MTTIRLYGVQEALRAFNGLPRNVQRRHLRIALSAGGGVIKNRAASLARRRTGLLSKSYAVKVTIPNAKPASAVIGTKRRAGKFFKLATLRGHGKAQREFKLERERLGEKEAVRFVRASFKGAVFVNPSRYAHLAGKDTLASAVTQTRELVVSRISEKLGAGIEREAAALAGR